MKAQTILLNIYYFQRLKPKKIYIDPTTELVSWVDVHHNIIVNTLYENIFDFVRGDELKRTVLKVITKNIPIYDRGVSYDFMLVRDDVNDTIDALIRNFEEMEDYEKCYELLQLKNEN
jgi:hypothetical protein